MARRTKLGNLDMRFKSSHRIVARRNFFGCLGSVLSVPFILFWNLIRTVAVKTYTQIHNSVTWYSSSIKLLRRELGPKKNPSLSQSHSCLFFHPKFYSPHYSYADIIGNLFFLSIRSIHLESY